MLFPRRVDSGQTRKSSHGPEHEVGFRLVLKALLQVDLLRKTLATQEQCSQHYARQNAAVPYRGVAG